MAEISPLPAAKLVFVFLLLFSASSPSPSLAHAFSFSSSFSQYKTLFSMSRTLILRVANLRASRGDVSGSARARFIAEKMERWLGLGFLSSVWSVGWDYARNYAWGRGGMDYSEMYGAISDLNELMGLVGELTRAESDADRAASVARNYGNALRVSKRLLRRLLKIFDKAGALREIWEMVQTEVVEGGLLKDCLEVSSEDVRSLLQIAKDMASKFFSVPNRSDEL